MDRAIFAFPKMRIFLLNSRDTNEPWRRIVSNDYSDIKWLLSCHSLKKTLVWIKMHFYERIVSVIIQMPLKHITIDNDVLYIFLFSSSMFLLCLLQQWNKIQEVKLKVQICLNTLVGVSLDILIQPGHEKMFNNVYLSVSEDILTLVLLHDNNTAE